MRYLLVTSYSHRSSASFYFLIFKNQSLYRDDSDEFAVRHTELLGEHSVLEPPESFSNSEVKRHSADDSVALAHAKVGHHQAPNTRKAQHHAGPFCVWGIKTTADYPAAHC